MLKQIILGTALTAAAFSSSHAADKNMPFGDFAFDVFKTSVELRTVTGQGQVPKYANYLADKFLEAGFPKEDIHILPLGETASLVVRFAGDGSSGKKPISISGHMDVVDAKAEDWGRDPFTLTEENGYFFGRGSIDNKAGITAVVTNFIRLKKEGWVPNRDLIIAFSGDEETAMTTTRALVSEHRALIDSEFMLNADVGGATIPEAGGTPASFSMQAAEKVYATFEMTVRNPGGHSARPREDNAIYDLAAAIKNIQDHKFPVRQNELTKAFFKSTGEKTEGDLGKAMRDFAANPQDENAIKALRAQPSYVGTIGTTCVPTMLRGGHAENALPQSVTATVNCRIFPGESVTSIEATLNKVVANDAVEISLITDTTESDASPLRDDVLSALQKAIDIKHPGLEIIPSMSSGGTDAMHFRAAGIPSYGVSGIYIKSSDMFAHGLNERIPVESFYDNIAHWYVLLKEIAGN